MDYTKFNPFNDAKYFHSYCPITDYNDDTMSQNCWLGDNKVSLPDLNTESKEVQNIWYDWVGSLVSNYSSKSFFFLPFLALPCFSENTAVSRNSPIYSRRTSCGHSQTCPERFLARLQQSRGRLLRRRDP